MPKSGLARTRLAAKAASNPMTVPASATTIPSPTMSLITRERLAPSAMRTPISFVRLLTE